MTAAAATANGHVAAIADEVRRSAEALLAAGEKLVAAEHSDLDHTAAFNEAVLVVTDRRLLACRRRNGRLDPGVEIALGDVRSLKRRELQGLCLLEAYTRDAAVPVACYTRSRLREFDLLIEAARPLLQAQPDTPADGGAGRNGSSWDPEGAQQHKLCPTCGKPIPHRIGFCPDCIDRRRLMLRLLGCARPYVWPMVGGLVLMLLITAVEMTQPLLTKVLVDDVIPHANMHLFVWVVLAIVGIYIFSSLFSGIRSYMLAWLGEKIVHDLRREVYGHLQTLSLDFYDQRQTGWIMDRVSADTSNLQNFL
ncbi:hypothetical protein GX586_07785, partial [bacterium]|nr:hypothetical protein [bacterium]